ncbi:CHRD domain-containing protein [Prosthecobacter sp.]|uniref:CHRD domain-containing protein n=1 Tax=Prosthecobacter sp. TaxID=1965333 RepID=UPI002ABA54E1|nr:CHRD domain-containing protein [Prosthecobacter sp.]MDZ4403028.1 CHRD domain-containing protein [Prosthecobacter sp.]
MKHLFLVCMAAFSLAAAGSLSASTILFDLQGTGGVGLLNTSEPGSPAGGTGGEIGGGISYDDVTNLLTINVGWGSSQGFTDLSSLSNNSHLHGPTTNNNGNGFTETAGVLFNLTRSSNATTGGTITQTLTALSGAQETDLLNGKYYINIHTVNNGGGELRGFLVQAVPEPSRTLLGMLGVGLLMFRRSRKA